MEIKMKILKNVLLVITTMLLLSSCTFSLREADVTAVKTDAVSTPSEITDAVSESVYDPPYTITETTAEEQTTVSEDTSAETSEDTTVEVTEETVEEMTDTAVAPVDPPTGTYKPKALMYHLILEEVYGPYENLFVRPSEFETHLTVLDELGYEYLFAEEWRMTEKPSVIITLDDGYEDNYTEMFPILKAHGAKATVFLVTDLIGTDGYMTREMIREMSESGLVSFQSHTSHHSDLSYQSADGLRADFDNSCAIIEELTGKPVKAIAYPAGSYNDTVLSVAAEYFDFAYTTKSPNSTPSYSELTVPRHYIARGYGRQMFLGFVRY